MKSFVAKLKEYNQEYREFILEMLKSLFIEKVLKQHETKDTLVKIEANKKNSLFGISKANFLIVKFSSVKKLLN